MRSLALLIGLCAVAVLAADDPSIEEWREKLATAARDAAAKAGGFEEYASYLQPLPGRLLKGEEMTDYILFAEGWSNMEPEGIWSDGDDSRFYLRMEPGKRPEMLYIHGRYHGQEERTRLFVNGRKLSEVPLIHQKIELPDSMQEGAELEFELQHIAPSRVAGEKEPGKDARPRRVEFFLVGIEVW